MPGTIPLYQPDTHVEHKDMCMQVLVSEIPPGLSGLDCNGSEASLLDCTTGDIITGECSVFSSAATDATVLACGNTSAGAIMHAIIHAIAIHWLCMPLVARSHDHLASVTAAAPCR